MGWIDQDKFDGIARLGLNKSRFKDHGTVSAGVLHFNDVFGRHCNARNKSECDCSNGVFKR